MRITASVVESVLDKIGIESAGPNKNPVQYNAEDLAKLIAEQLSEDNSCQCPACQNPVADSYHQLYTMAEETAGAGVWRTVFGLLLEREQMRQSKPKGDSPEDDS